jgi:hypothetical protein
VPPAMQQGGPHGLFQTTSCISSTGFGNHGPRLRDRWAHLEAREPFRDRQKDGELQNALRKLVFDSTGSDKINFDALCDRVLASMPDTWMVIASGEPRKSPKALLTIAGRVLADELT